MSGSGENEVGSIGWIDLTVENAAELRDFYARTTGWVPSPVAMGDYEDFNMTAPESGEPKAGICHARGSNAELPAQWLIYITVADVDASADECARAGGKLLVAPKDMGNFGRYCVIEDPAGAVAALFAHRQQT